MLVIKEEKYTQFPLNKKPFNNDKFLDTFKDW